MSGIRALAKKKKEMMEAISQYNRYVEKRTAFEGDQGIFHPIRAIVKIYTSNNFNLRRLMNDAMMVQEIIDTKTMDDKDKGFKEFVRQSTIVGYITVKPTVLANGTCECATFGHSFCRPSDFPMYQKHIGMLNAIEQSNQLIIAREDFDSVGSYLFCENLEGKLNVKYIFEPCGKDGIIVYYFPVTIGDQIHNFVDRCKRYLK